MGIESFGATTAAVEEEKSPQSSEEQVEKKEANAKKYMNTVELAEFFEDEYQKRTAEMDNHVNEYHDHTPDEKRGWSREVSKWGDVSNELLTHEKSENAMTLVEGEIENVAQIIAGQEDVATLRRKSGNSEGEKESREMIRKYKEKLGKLRRVLASLYAIQL